MKPLRFVILQHDFQGTHYDLMLEVGSVLRTWKLAQPPAAGVRQRAEPSFDHRPFYLDHEGPVSGNRGQVKRWDAGTYEGDLPAAAPIRLRLAGQRLRGHLELHPGPEGGDWELLFLPEESETG
jgi:hypothetical protein